MSDSEGLWDAAEVARFLRMSRRWVYKSVSLGAVPHLRIGSSLRFVPEEIRAYVGQQRASTNIVRLPTPKAGRTNGEEG